MLNKLFIYFNHYNDSKTLSFIYFVGLKMYRKPLVYTAQCRVVRDRTPGPFYRMLGQTHMNGWSCVIASQNGGSTNYIFPLD